MYSYALTTSHDVIISGSTELTFMQLQITAAATLFAGALRKLIGTDSAHCIS